VGGLGQLVFPVRRRGCFLTVPSGMETLLRAVDLVSGPAKGIPSTPEHGVLGSVVMGFGGLCRLHLVQPGSFGAFQKWVFLCLSLFRSNQWGSSECPNLAPDGRAVWLGADADETGHASRCAANVYGKGVALLDLRFSGYEGSFAGANSPYDFSSFLTIFSLPRGLGRDEEATDGTVSGTR
jgi:hypothetical protein